MQRDISANPAIAPEIGLGLDQEAALRITIDPPMLTVRIGIQDDRSIPFWKLGRKRRALRIHLNSLHLIRTFTTSSNLENTTNEYGNR